MGDGWQQFCTLPADIEIGKAICLDLLICIWPEHSPGNQISFENRKKIVYPGLSKPKTQSNGSGYLDSSCESTATIGLYVWIGRSNMSFSRSFSIWVESSSPVGIIEFRSSVPKTTWTAKRSNNSVFILSEVEFNWVFPATKKKVFLVALGDSLPNEMSSKTCISPQWQPGMNDWFWKAKSIYTAVT